MGSLMLVCGLATVDGSSGCMLRTGQDILCQTKLFAEKTGTSYTFRAGVLDPDKMTFRFLVNGAAIGDCAVSAADLSAYKDVNFFLMAGLNAPTVTTAAGSYNIGYLAVEQR
jgi:hypothetical protein